MIFMNVQLKRKTQKKIIPAFSMIAIMLLSPQISLLLNTEILQSKTAASNRPKERHTNNWSNLGDQSKMGIKILHP